MHPPRSRPLRLIIGRNPLMEALQAGTMIEKIFLLRSAVGPEIGQIKKWAAQKSIPLVQVPQEKLDRLTKAQHQGVVALAGLLTYIELQDGISHIVESAEVPLLLLLDGITDVRNIGAIARTAWCCGAQGLILPASHAATLGEEALKTSAGALQKIMLLRSPSTQQAMDVLRLNGIQILGTELRASIPLQEALLDLPTCIVMGAEDKGISKEVIRRADALIHIPMVRPFDSLNVSVAAGMALYEAMQQRRSQKT
ncbi:MAG: 23S rRNA (guanosine(2251)-2'-O)-methyltransferase RlmB [Bacteroidetes bacterium]|nr:23S rRNA (guanosine(2251)-2'-O)-methyltransferase RlmB [Bacteroidota bacterium]MBS1629731.1 23S rRNA (guanosine(2251)-2'-O)-methyltransferase RlmB [Bacteroidota bacterium]